MVLWRCVCVSIYTFFFIKVFLLWYFCYFGWHRCYCIKHAMASDIGMTSTDLFIYTSCEWTRECIRANVSLVKKKEIDNKMANTLKIRWLLPKIKAIFINTINAWLIAIEHHENENFRQWLFFSQLTYWGNKCVMSTVIMIIDYFSSSVAVLYLLRDFWCSLVGCTMYTHTSSAYAMIQQRCDNDDGDGRILYRYIFFTPFFFGHKGNELLANMIYACSKFFLLLLLLCLWFSSSFISKYHHKIGNRKKWCISRCKLDFKNEFIAIFVLHRCNATAVDCMDRIRVSPVCQTGKLTIASFRVHVALVLNRMYENVNPNTQNIEHKTQENWTYINLLQSCNMLCVRITCTKSLEPIQFLTTKS